MRFFRNFPEFRIFPDLRGHSRGNPRCGLIFMGGEGGIVGTINCVYFATQSLIIAYTIILINFETITIYRFIVRVD